MSALPANSSVLTCIANDEGYDKIFSLQEILNLLDEKPEIKNINEKYVGVNWYRTHLDELKSITKKNTRNI
ncbi:MAG: hypothetical protein IH784_03280 [Bacteroidetes bacterium]|nr:hypothetical protein [Bacteroidota bacterium]